MKLYYSPGACSLAPHIVLEELGSPFQVEKIDIQHAPSPEFLKLNPLGAVPVLAFDSGETLTEAAVILQYLADSKPEAQLAPRAGTLERVRLQECLNFLATEVHKGFGPLFGADSMVSDAKARSELREAAKLALVERFAILSARLGSRDFLMPSGFTVADAYLFTLMRWARFHKIDIAPWPNLAAYKSRLGERPAVVRALKAEGIA